MDSSNAQVGQIKIRKDFNPQNIIIQGLHRFESQYGFRPKGLLLGPDDYKYFLEFQEIGQIENKTRIQLMEPNTILGLPYRIKATNGIEFEIEQNQWMIFAKKENE